MTEMEQLAVIIQDPQTSVEKLKDLLGSANQQLARYARAQSLLDNAHDASWTYESYQEVLRVGSGNNKATTITQMEWNQLLPAHRNQLRANMLGTVQEGKHNFEGIKSMIEMELSKRKSSKPWWQFWK